MAKMNQPILTGKVSQNQKENKNGNNLGCSFAIFIDEKKTKKGNIYWEMRLVIIRDMEQNSRE